MAAALLSLLRENMIQMQSHKLMQAGLSYYIAYGEMHICITLPSPLNTVRYALKCIKKTIGPLLTKRASKIYFAIRKDAKKNPELVQNTIAKTLNDAVHIVVYGRQAKDQTFIDSLQTFLPKKIEHSNDVINRVQAMITAEGPYRPMKRFDNLSEPCKAIVLAAFQIADFDFFADKTHKAVYINKQHFNNPQLVSLRKFIAAKTKFLLKPPKKDAQDKPMIALLSAMYNHSATALIVNKQMILEERTKKDLQMLLSDFSELFPKTMTQL